MHPVYARRLLIAIVLILVLLGGAVGYAGQAQYRGNSKSYIFHASHCKYFFCKNCVVKFLSRQAALDAGFRPCKICKP